MELTLNELKIIRNALNSKLRTVHLKSSEFGDIKQSFNKVNAEIERIEKDIIKKTYDEAFRAVSDILKPKKINHSFINLEVILDKIQEAYDETFREISDILKPKKMKDFLKNSKITDSKIELIEPNYEGIAKVLAEFEKLYKVCENKKLLDKCLENFCSPKMFFNGDS